MYESTKYNITVDHENGVCNVIFSALNPFFTGDALTYYTYDGKQRKFEEHIIDMKDCIAVSLLKVN